MRSFSEPLPIDDVLPSLLSALDEGNAAVLVAPPGAGKTTRVPLVLADAPWMEGRKVLVLEPRRLAARAAAERMAATVGEKLGESVGLRARFGSHVSARTRIEVITEGVFTRLIMDDPELRGVGAILFDEFHERSLDADLGLALARDAQQGLREDLRLLVMSATLDGARVARLLCDAPVIASEGRAFPVETRYLGRDMRTPIEPQMAEAIARVMRSDPGSVLAFLPGVGEIRRTEALLRERLAQEAIDIVPLYGALDRDMQDRAIAPVRGERRKVVLATSIAETSITIQGVRIVVDCGLARVPRNEPDAGLTRLETVRVSRAAADQRRGRAGRTEPGLCLRLWDEPQTASLEPFARAELLSSDLSGFALDLAHWGVADPRGLAFLDAPPRAAFSEAQKLLRSLGALDADGRITEEGRHLRRLPLPPRLARMVIQAAAQGAGREAGELAMLMSERGLGGDDIDLTERLASFRRDRSSRAQEARAMAARWTRLAGHVEGAAEAELSAGRLMALAFPDRIAKNRGSDSFVLANGRGATIDPVSPLARIPFLAVAEMTGTAARARILSAAPLTLADIEAAFGAEITSREFVEFDAGSRSLRGRRARVLGALALSEQPLAVMPSEATAQMLAAGLVNIGLQHLPWSRDLLQWRDRVVFLRAAEGDEWPDLSDAALVDNAETWLAPALTGKTALAQFTSGELAAALHELLPRTLRQRLDEDAPTHFDAPSGLRIPIDYQNADGPMLSVRVQELFGLTSHPTIAGGRVPLVLELLSPASRPVQVTRDLPAFWRGSYAAVRSEMRGRYPRHPWPGDPAAAPATRRAKPRGT